MPIAILEPIEAGIIVALVNKYIINNHKLCEYMCGTQEVPEAKQPQEDASSTTTSIHDAEVHMHHTQIYAI